MSRSARKQSSSKYYHVMVRGNERKKIFKEDDEKEKILKIIQRTKVEKEFEIIAYCIMDNHAHLIIKEGKDTIARSMKRIEVSYAIYYNKKYNRIGHLFQDRFRSEPVETDRYILECIRYIHNNPVKACIRKTAKDYIWSSYNTYLYDRKDFLEINRDFVLNIFSNDEDKAIKEFIRFSSKSSEMKFIDMDEKINEVNLIEWTEKTTKIKQILKGKKIEISEFKDVTDKKIRNEIISNISKEVKVSIRELAELLEISKDIVFRAMK